MAPDIEDALDAWESAKRTIDRTSNRLLIYSMDKDQPQRYGILLLAFLAPEGHKMLTQGVNALVRHQLWEDIAYTHQMSGKMPTGTITEP